MPKKVLILYSHTGGGHLTIAQSIASEIKRFSESIEVVLVDGLKEDGYDPDQAYLLSVSNLELPVDLGYKFVNSVITSKFAKYFLNKKFGKNLKNIIKKHNPDIAVSVHSFICPSTISDFSNLTVPFYQVVVNLSLNVFEADPNSRKIFLPTNEWMEFAKRYISQDKLVLTGFPIRKQFVYSKHQISNKILVMGGGTGVGGLQEIALKLNKSITDKTITIICGKNQKLKDVLEKQFPNFTILGYVEEIEKLIAESDIVITKAGANSILETSTVGRPVIATSWKGRWEKYNTSFIEENSLGIYCPEVNNIPEAIKMIYQNIPKYIHPEKIINNGSSKIAKEILSGI